MSMGDQYLDDLQHRFEYHPPHDDATRGRHEAARALMLATAEQFAVLLPKCREKSLVITKLEEALFWANAAIARNQSVEGEGLVPVEAAAPPDA